MKKNKTLFGLPEKIKFCKQCVISNQRPNSTIEFKHQKNSKKKVISFNKKNICSACQYNEIKQNIDWFEREEKLIKLCEKIKKNKKSEYDCVVPGSGGKDSAYTAHILKYKYGLNPLTVTWAPHLYTEIGWQNFQNWSHIGGFDNILFTPNGRLHRLLTKLAFENLLHPFQPFILGQRIIGPKIAKKFGIKYVFYGENQAEYGNNISENKNEKMNNDFFSRDYDEELVFGGIKMNEIMNDYNFTRKDFSPYDPLKKKDIDNLEVHYLGYYLKWDPQECYYYAVENTGFKPNRERTEGSYSKYSSIDDKIDPFHYFTTFIKFGIGRATYDASQEIRNGKINREEGMRLVQLYDNEFPQKYFDEFLKYISLNEKQFFNIVDKFRSPHLWKKNKLGKWQLRNSIK